MVVRSSLLLGILAALLLAANPASSIPITFGFEGTVAIVGSYTGNTSLLADHGIGVGTPVTATYTFQSTNPDGSTPGGGLYGFESGTLSIGDISVDLGPYAIGGIVVGNHPSMDTYALLGAAMSGLPDGIADGQMSFELRDPTGTALDSDALLLEPPNLEDWLSFHTGPGANSFGYITFGVDGIGLPDATVEFEFTDFHAPEPGTGLMLGLGLILLGGQRRRNRR